jgi:long-chain acyl-CoA synthetase
MTNNMFKPGDNNREESGTSGPADVLVPEAFLTCARRLRQAPALVASDGVTTTTVSHQVLLEEVLDAAAVLLDHGVAVGDRVCVHVPTSISHTVWDLAVLVVGAVAVPVYDTDSVEQIEWILTDADPVVLVASHALVGTSGEAHRNLAHRSVVVDTETRASARRDQEVLDRTAALQGVDLAGIIYTSGTTGRSKGCVLSHGAFAAAVRASKAAFPEEMAQGERTLLFLPLAHVFARVVQYACVTSGVEIAYSSAQTVAQDVLWARPSWMVTVPRVLEKVHAGARAKSTGIKRRIFTAADHVACAWAVASERGSVPFWLEALRAVFDRLVYGKIRAALGGELRAVVSGGAALDPRLDRFFTGCGITVYEGYGLTETAAAHCANTPGSKRAGSVGQPLLGFEAVVDSDGEVLLRGANLFSGYWRNEAATSSSFQEIDGSNWFKTGDLGAIDDAGFLRITGRRKELIVTSNGKNVQPVGLEEDIVRGEGISQCVVVGDGRPFIAALVALDAEWVQRRALELGATKDVVRESAEVRTMIQSAIDVANRAVSRAEAVKAFRVLPEELSTDNGLLTPTLKVKRTVVAQRHADLIEEMYA